MPFIDTAIPDLTESNLEPFADKDSILEISEDSLYSALRDVALEELEIARCRYARHLDPVRCAVSISLVLRSLAKDLYGERRIELLRGVGWLNFLLRTSNSGLFGPHVIETMSAALFGDPSDAALPNDCEFWFAAAENWIQRQGEIALRQS